LVTNLATTDNLRERRGFWSLIITQFQGAFSDNVHKSLVIFLIGNVVAGVAERDRLASLIGFLFAIPFILFSMSGGWLADRFSKRSVTIGVKLLEIAVMALATIGLGLRHIPLLLLCIFLMSLQSALFGPSKYGLLPELLSEKRLSWGNGIIQLGTNVAIVTGVAVAGPLSDLFRGREALAGLVLVGLAGIGTLTSLGITRLPAANPERRFRLNFLGDLWAQLGIIRRDRVLALAISGEVYFSFLGSLLLLNIFIYGKDIFQATDSQISLLQAAVAVGIGLGSFAAGHLSFRKIEYGLVPLGAIGITAFCALLGRGGLAFAEVAWLLAGLGFFGGFYIVPLGALIQYRPDPTLKGAVLGSASTLSFAGVAVSAGVFYLLRQAGLTAPQIFMAGAAMTLAGTAYVVWLLPDSLLRMLLWMITNTIYRIRVEGRDNIPEKGGALFVCNHVSFVDALLLIASTDRLVRGIVFKDIYEHPLVKPFAKIMRAIPISAQQRPREMLKSLRAASDAIRNGEVVVIFAEGQITRIGQLLPFRRGMQYIMRDVDAPIIPVNLDGVWGSIFSFERGRFFGKLPRRIPYPVTVSFGRPMPATATPFEVRQAVQQLQSDAWPLRKRLMQPLQRALIHIGRRHPFRFAMADQRVPKLTYGAALMRSVFLARRLRRQIAGEEMVGVLMPPSVGGALVNYALMLMARAPINLNYTASDEVVASCARQCDLKTVITSRAFLEKVKIAVPAKAIYIEDLIQGPRRSEKLMALWMSFLLPARMLERNIGRERRLQLDDLATVIFSSGTTGEPKGVMLTHYNIASNIEQAGQMFAFKPSDRILGVLPFFHSFGFTVTLVLPPVIGPGVVYHHSPLDARAIGQLAQKHRVTFLLSTPTFLQMYLRAVEPEQFGSLQFVVTGAEKLPQRIADAFEERFGIRPLEGYGCTECAPVVAVNTRDFRAAGFRQVGAKRGKIGHPMPGVSVKVVDPETFAPLPLGEAGMLLVKGPNIMKGYLGQPGKTAEAIRDGWYVTGDIAALDEEGFIQITDRAARFSKIGGEMVPHIKIEEKLHELAGATEHTFSVTGVPDERKGERLVVLHTLPDEKLRPVLEQLAGCDLPNLWKPRPDQFYRIEAFPHLGSGKLDLRKVRDMAAEICR
jgi:acyl-[acyl-carrier-protein]-phospholipid O-acyltransferase/long-chain-fatty-acid--[acyl-carrier-protein] ligase